MQSIIKCIKIVSIAVIAYEVYMGASLTAAVYQFSQIVEKVDHMIQGGLLAVLIPAALRISSSFHIRSYAATRTDRTPENKVAMSQFLWLVTLVSFGATLVILNALNQHAEQTVNNLTQMSNMTNGLDMTDTMIQVTDQIASLQTALFTGFAGHCLMHFLTHRLNKHEEDVPRVVDLHAARSKPHTH